MDLNPEWWHWAVAGIGLILAELAVPAFVLIWFGAGALAVALVLALSSISWIAQLALWLVISVALTIIWFRFFKPGQLKTRIGASDPSVVGEVGLLSHSVGPFERGEVRLQKPVLGADVWPCISDETINAGERVRVVSVEGSLLKVTKT